MSWGYQLRGHDFLVVILNVGCLGSDCNTFWPLLLLFTYESVRGKANNLGSDQV